MLMTHSWGSLCSWHTLGAVYAHITHLGQSLCQLIPKDICTDRQKREKNSSEQTWDTSLHHAGDNDSHPSVWQKESSKTKNKKEIDGMSSGSTLTISWHCMGWSCIHPCWMWACDSHSPFQDWRRQSLPHIFLMRSSLAAFGCWQLVPSERLRYWHLAMTITLCEMTSYNDYHPFQETNKINKLKH